MSCGVGKGMVGEEWRKFFTFCLKYYIFAMWFYVRLFFKCCGIEEGGRRKQAKIKGLQAAWE